MQALDSIKLAVALRMARTAVGWSQEELASNLGMSKTTIARMETMEGGLRADQLSAILRLYKSVGVELEFMLSDEVTVKISAQGLEEAQRRLLDQNLRRADRKKTGTGLLSTAHEETVVGISSTSGGLLSQAKPNAKNKT